MVDSGPSMHVMSMNDLIAEETEAIRASSTLCIVECSFWYRRDSLAPLYENSV